MYVSAIIYDLHDLDPFLVLRTCYSQMQVNITSTRPILLGGSDARILIISYAISLVQFLDVALLLDDGGELPVSPDQPGQQPHVGGEEGEALQPDEHEGVVPLYTNK